MIQEIAPAHFDITYRHHGAGAFSSQGRCFIFAGRRLLVNKGAGWQPPCYGEIASRVQELEYLFCIDEQEFYLAHLAGEPPQGYSFEDAVELRARSQRELAFAAMTAYHLAVWYDDNHFCGRCGQLLVRDEGQRMLRCPQCGNMIFPKIAPAVIVAVTAGERLLLTRYRGREYRGPALIAGFIEAGETAELAAQREVMEEAGVRIKNLRYFDCQPWGQHQDLLLGYFAELDGDDTIHLDDQELAAARWYDRRELDFPLDDISLTAAMMRAFKEGRA